ncbi:MAG: rod shape-determining protein MreC, partial [bacterium]|nr:rod shape-determining protein MreC [bacterium]
MAYLFLFIKRLFLAAVIFLLILSVLSRGKRFSAYHEDPWFLRPIYMAAAPFQKSALFFKKSFHEKIDRYVFLFDAWEENQKLKSENAVLEAKVLLFNEISNENERLRDLQGWQNRSTWKSLSARVIGYDSLASSRILTIDRGTKDGLKRRQPVISKEGLVGQIYRVSSKTSQVLLLTDPSSQIDVRSDRSRARGLIRGFLTKTKLDRDDFVGRLAYLERSQEIQVGDLMVTSGLNDLFPKGIPVGDVSSVKVRDEDVFQEAIIEPKVNIGRLE